MIVLIILFLLVILYPKLDTSGVKIIEEEKEEKKKGFIDKFFTPLFIPTSPKHNIDVKSNNRIPKLDGDHFKSKGEKICCDFLTQRFDADFKTYRPNFLRNPKTGKNLELDCFNPHFYIKFRAKNGDHKISRLALEYNGIQHYEWPNFTKCTEKQFYDQKDRDQYKISKCEKEDIYLITVPHTIHHEMIPTYIEGKLPKNFTIISS